MPVYCFLGFFLESEGFLVFPRVVGAIVLSVSGDLTTWFLVARPMEKTSAIELSFDNGLAFV